MINWKTFKEVPADAEVILVNETKLRPFMVGIVIQGEFMQRFGDDILVSKLIEENREWEYVDQLQSKSKDIEIDGHGNKMTVPNG